MNKIFTVFAAATLLLSIASCAGEGKSDANKAPEAAETANNAEATSAKPLPIRNAEAGAAFLDSLKANDPDVKFTESGMAYKVVKEGNGVKPTRDQTVNVKYTGRHIDGSVFDSSGDQVISFPLNRVIEGFSEGISLMPVGSTYVLYIPGYMAYGPNGAGGDIGPNETLIFDVELVGIE